MSPADARRFLATMTTTAPALRHLTPWDRMQLQRDLDDAAAVNYAQLVKAHLMADHPTVFAPSGRKDGTR